MKKILYLGIILFLITGCTSNKELLEKYLVENNYEKKGYCYRRTDEKQNIVVQYCLNECKYLSMDKERDDYFVLYLKNRQIEYIDSYITYKTDINGEEATCYFQGEEIDLESSYCKNAKTIFEKHYKILKEEQEKSKVNFKYVCK